MMDGSPVSEGQGQGKSRRNIRTLKMAEEYLDAVAMGHGTVKVAQLTGLHNNTVSSRMQDLDWQAAVQLRRETMLGSAAETFRTRLAALIVKTFDALEELLEYSEPRVRVRAVGIAMDHAAKLVDKIPTGLAPRPESNVDKLLQHPLTEAQVLAEIAKAGAERDGATED